MPSHSKETPDLLPGTLYLLILRTLARGPLHGYAISRRIKEASADVLEVEEGSLYPVLQRLLKEEVVKAESSISSTHRTYQLTAKGAKHGEHEVSRFENMLEGITGVLAPGES